MRRLLMAATLLAMGAAGAAPPVFKCVDGDKITYQDHPCDDIHASQCHSYAATPIVAQSGNVMTHYNALFAMIDKELAQKRAAAEASMAVAAATKTEADASDGDEHRKYCDDALASMKDPSAVVGCEEYFSGHVTQGSAPVMLAGPGRR